MPARDRLHDHVRGALVNDGWTITHDPLHVRWGSKDMYVDLGAERFLGAEKGEQKIAVEIKTFLGPSHVTALENALGQFTLYREVLASTDPDRTLYLAVSKRIHREVFEDPLGALLLARGLIKLLIFSTESEVIEQWTPAPPTAK